MVIFYANATQAYLRKLQVTQNRVLRIIYRLSARENTDQYHNKMNISKLDIRRKLHMVQLASWLANQEQFRDTRSLPTRSHADCRKNIKLHQVNKSQYRNSLFYQASTWWNELPTEIHCIKDRDKQKLEIKKYVLYQQGNLAR